MCSICGGTRWDVISERIWDLSRDRGRDAHGLFHCPNDGPWIGNHRATPTTEVESPKEKQPVGDNNWRFVFNGIIANDAELGIQEGEADTSVIPRVVEPKFRDLTRILEGVVKLKGSYAIAALHVSTGEIQLACNYRPIWVVSHPNGHFYFSSLRHHLPMYLPAYRMKPYSVQFLASSPSSGLDIPRIQGNKALVICSSGLDSTAVAAYACHTHGPQLVTLIHFDYGCLATRREISCIKQIAEYLHCSHIVIPFQSFGSSPLLNPGTVIASDVAGAEYAHEWVPARNLVMLAQTVAYAEAHDYGHIYIGTNLEEAGAYPDNEEQFILDFAALLSNAVQNGVKIEIHTPLGNLMKHEIVPFGLKYNTPFHLTWSCYRGQDKHCGECGPCFMRKTAFERNGLKDPVFQ